MSALVRLDDLSGPLAEHEQGSSLADLLRESEERYEILASVANDGIWDWDLSTNRVAFSSRWKQMLGYEDGEISDNPNEWFVRVHPQDVEQVSLEIAAHTDGSRLLFESRHRMLHKNGTYRWMLTRGRVACDGEGRARRMVGSQTDITDRRNAEEEIVRRAFYDSLTGLPNRALFMDNLWRSVELAKRRKTYTFAVLFIDLDRFKIVNDSLGHLAGDALLVSIAQRLEKCLRQTDLLARLSGDEFAILLDHIHGADDARTVADRIQAELARPIDLDAHSVFTTASIGIALSSDRYEKPEDMLRDADMAMYKAKASGKARYEIYDSAMHDQVLKLLYLENDLRRAIAQNELRVFFQPIVDLETGRVIGLEALVRWEHPQHGLIPPGEFIPVAEETGSIVEIDRWVLLNACEQVARWNAEDLVDEPLSVSVNLSSKQFSRGDLVGFVEWAIDETGLDPTCLKLEITESALMENPDTAADMLSRLKALGIDLLIDDFGTGYSSLSYLHNFPIDTLKIDRAFVAKLIRPERKDHEIVRSIVMLAHNLGLDVIAEGVETSEQLAALRQLTCRYGQGYLFSPPLPPDALVDSLRGAWVIESAVGSG
jgi:diguanylate cyclase (GGDEF)-like protein/PAS domain S-box-containing protein